MVVFAFLAVWGCKVLAPPSLLFSMTGYGEGLNSLSMVGTLRIGTLCQKRKDVNNVKKRATLVIALFFILSTLTAPALADNTSPYTYRGDKVEITNVTSMEENYDGMGPGWPVYCNAPVEITTVADVMSISVYKAENRETVLPVQLTPIVESQNSKNNRMAGIKYVLTEPGKYELNIHFDAMNGSDGAFSSFYLLVSDEDITTAELDYETPPVATVYNPAADLNNDGHVDKAEWETWVAAHPEDLDQDLIITDEEQATYDANHKVMPTSCTILVNGQAVDFDAYVISGNNYMKLRDISMAINDTSKQFNVTWDGKQNAINIISNTPYSAVGGELAKGDGTAKNATPCTSTILLNGQKIELTGYTIGQNNYFKLRDLGSALGFIVDWDGANNTVTIDTGSDSTTQSDDIGAMMG